MRCEDCIKQDYFVLCLWSVAIADVARTGYRQKLVFLFAEKEMRTQFSHRASNPYCGRTSIRSVAFTVSVMICLVRNPGYN